MILIFEFRNDINKIIIYVMFAYFTRNRSQTHAIRNV